MANQYLESYRSGGTGDTSTKQSSGNSYLNSYRAEAPVRDEETKKRKKKEEDDKRQAEAKRQADKPWYQKGLEGVGKAFTTDLAKNVGEIVGVGKEMVVDPAAKLVQQIQTSSQVQSHNNGAPVVGDNFAKNQNAEIDRALKAGEINKQKAGQLRSKTTNAVNTTKSSIKTAEKNVGVKYNPDEGVQGLLDTVGNLAGTEGIIKGSAELAAKTGSSLINKLTGKQIAKDVIKDEIKPIIPKTEAPTQIPSPPKPIDVTTTKRSDKYLIDTTKPRVTQVEAEQKLVKAGYTTEESKKILEDVLPEKGLSMPGSPKKIGYNENKILEAANEYDKTPSIAEMEGNKVTDDIASQYKSSDDYINQAVDRTWAENKKGAGTDIVYKHENDLGTGSDSLQGTRISNNNPYYRAVFDETGKAPTKARIRQDITEFLNGKDNAAKHLLDPEERGVVDLLRERESSLATKDKVPEGILPPDGSNVAPLASVDGKAEIGTSKLGSSVQETAVHEKLIKKTEADVDGLQTYNKANMKQQAEYATQLIKDSPYDALDIAMGRKAPPEHILQQMVFNAVEDHAKKIGGDKGAQLLLDLSKSRQSTNLTKMGQEIRAAAERDPHSPVTMMNEVKLARIDAAKARGKDLSKAIKEDTKAIKDATPKVKKEDWDSFIKGLEC